MTQETAAICTPLLDMLLTETSSRRQEHGREEYMRATHNKSWQAKWAEDWSGFSGAERAMALDIMNRARQPGFTYNFSSVIDANGRYIR